MTVNEAKQAILDRFLDNWTGTTVDDTHVERENQVFDGPPSPAAPWVRIVIDPRVGRQRTLAPVGSRTYNRRGAVLVSIFVPRGEGSTNTDALVQEVRSIFEGAEVDGIHFFATQERVVEGIKPDADWYQVNTETEFLYTERR